MSAAIFLNPEYAVAFLPTPPSVLHCEVVHVGRAKSKTNFKVHVVHLLIFIWKDMIFFSQTQFSFKISLNMLQTDLITMKYCCQNLQQALVSEKETPYPFTMVCRTQDKYVLPNFFYVHIYTCKEFPILKQIKGKSKHQPRAYFRKTFPPFLPNSKG